MYAPVLKFIKRNNNFICLDHCMDLYPLSTVYIKIKHRAFNRGMLKTMVPKCFKNCS